MHSFILALVNQFYERQTGPAGTSASELVPVVEYTQKNLFNIPFPLFFLSSVSSILPTFGNEKMVCLVFNTFAVCDVFFLLTLTVIVMLLKHHLD